MKKDFVIAQHETNTENAVFVRGSKRPFGMVFDFEGWRFTFSVTSKAHEWSASKLQKKEKKDG